MNNDEFEILDDLSEHANLPKVLINSQKLNNKQILNNDNNKNDKNGKGQEETKINKELAGSLKIENKKDKIRENILSNKKDNKLMKSHIIKLNKKNLLQENIESVKKSDKKAKNYSKNKYKLTNNINIERNSLDKKIHIIHINSAISNKVSNKNQPKDKNINKNNSIKKELIQNINKVKSIEKKSFNDYKSLKKKEGINDSNRKEKKNIFSREKKQAINRSADLIINKAEEKKPQKFKNQNKLKNINIKKINNIDVTKSVEISNTTINSKNKFFNKFSSSSIKENKIQNMGKKKLKENISNKKDAKEKKALINNNKRNSKSVYDRSKMNIKSNNKYKNILVKEKNLKNKGIQLDVNKKEQKKKSTNSNKKENNNLLKSYEKKETNKEISEIKKEKDIIVSLDDKNEQFNKTQNQNIRLTLPPKFNLRNKENINKTDIKEENINQTNMNEENINKTDNNKEYIKHSDMKEENKNQIDICDKEIKKQIIISNDIVKKEEDKNQEIINNLITTPEKGIEKEGNSSIKTNESKNTSSSKKVKIKYKVLKSDKINFIKEFDYSECQNIKLLRQVSEDENTLINTIKCHYGLSKAGKDQLGKTKINQDSYFILTNINNIKEFNIFGVLDGHGPDGHLVSQFISKYMQLEFQTNQLIKNIKDIEKLYEKLISKDYEIIKDIFINADNTLRDEEIDSSNSGTTCVLVINIGVHIICANVGDSRGILVFDEKNDANLNSLNVFPLSIDNKPENSKEKERIVRMGGVVDQIKNSFGQGIGPFRVWAKNKDFPGLAMSRSIGDFNGKNIGIIPEPEIIECNLSFYCKYIVICSDGVWEFLNNKDVMNIGKKFYLENNPRALCKELIDKSTKFWEKNDIVIDDITVVVIFF